MPDHAPASDMLPPTASVADGVVLLLGLWTAGSPWLLDYLHTRSVVVDVATGGFVAVFALLPLLRCIPVRFAAVVNAAAGLWLIIAASTLGQTAVVRINELLIGAMICGISLLGAAQASDGQPGPYGEIARPGRGEPR